VHLALATTLVGWAATVGEKTPGPSSPAPVGGKLVWIVQKKK